MDQKALARKNLERRLGPLRGTSPPVPQRGWLKAIRESLGMTTTQFARRLGVTQPRIIALEKAESNGTASMNTLREAAEAMNCTLVYAVVPTEPLDKLLRDQAARKAALDLARLDHTMRLEDQALSKADLDAERQRMIDNLLSGSLRGLWDDE
jgi:predicted DNA-binding mobile mystery protein A